jgi:hypothetical protein
LSWSSWFDGDVIEVMPGLYKGAVGVITHKQLVIRGLGERPVFDADGRQAEGKAIWVIRDGDITIENIEFRGARVPDANGAGIRFEKGRLLLRSCRFADNQIGLLTANFIDAELRIVDSEFSQAVRQVGSLPHLLYIGRIARAEITGSRFHQGFEGHLIKSRARVNHIAYNLIVDGPGGGASYEVDLPNGGDAIWVIGNLIGQSRDTQNPVMVAYGAEGRVWERNHLLMSHNTLVSNFPLTWFLRSWDRQARAGHADPRGQQPHGRHRHLHARLERRLRRQLADHRRIPGRPDAARLRAAADSWLRGQRCRGPAHAGRRSRCRAERRVRPADRHPGAETPGRLVAGRAAALRRRRA